MSCILTEYGEIVTCYSFVDILRSISSHSSLLDIFLGALWKIYVSSQSITKLEPMLIILYELATRRTHNCFCSTPKPSCHESLILELRWNSDESIKRHSWKLKQKTKHAKFKSHHQNLRLFHTINCKLIS